jgi:hypothetical protein
MNEGNERRAEGTLLLEGLQWAELRRWRLYYEIYANSDYGGKAF